MGLCSVCSEPQFRDVNGMNCQNGHAGASAQERVELAGGLSQNNQVVAKPHIGDSVGSDTAGQVIEMVAPVVPVDKLVKIFVKIRDAKAEKKKAYEAEAKILDEKLAMVATELKARAQSEGVEGFRTEFGAVYLSETMKTSCADWSAFGDFLKTHDPLEFMEKRISSTAIKEFMKANEGQLPPGVSIFKELEARVRRAGEK